MPGLRAAIIGCGGIAERHARGFSVPGRCEVVAGADLDPGNLQRTCDTLGIPGRYTDHREMLRAESPDLVAICTWPNSHAALTSDCVAAGVRGILCEKPMAISPAECDRMIDACDAAGIFLGVGHHLRFQPGVAAARNSIASGELGTVLLMRSSSRDGLTNNASHQIDLARCILGDPTPEWAMGQVERLTDRFERRSPIEDCAVGEITFSDSARLLLESDLTDDTHHLLVIGEHGMLRVMGRQTYRFDGSGGWHELEAGAAPHQHLSFLDWMEGGPLYASHARNGRAPIECIAAIYESSRLRRRISFPLAIREDPLAAMISAGDLVVQQPGPYDIRPGARWRDT